MPEIIHTILAEQVWTPTEHHAEQTINIAGGKIVAVNDGYTVTSRAGEGLLDASNAILIPGLIDWQVNGALGHSFQADERDHFAAVVDYHLAAGTTTFLPTLVTAPAEVLSHSLAVLAEYIEQGPPALLPGIHLEGPFLNPEKSGAHDQNALCHPDPALMQRFTEAAADKLRLVTLAPELPGAIPLIEQLVRQGIIVSAGHTAATFDDLRRAADAGLSLITHAGNASDWPHRAPGPLGFMSSEPGVVGGLLADSRLGAGIIMDGFHFHPTLLGPLLQLKGPDRLMLVSDASTVAGSPPGEYEGGGLLVTVDPRGFATSGRGGGWLAGSTITLLQAVQRAVKIAGLTLQDAVHMATLGPARLLGLAGRKGQISLSADADLLILNRDLSLRHVLVGGELISR